MVGPFEDSKHWVSAYELTRTPRVIHIDNDRIYVGSMPTNDDVTFTVVVIVDVGNNLDTISSLASLKYRNYTTLFIYRNAEQCNREAGYITSFKHIMPFSGVFRPKNDLTLSDAINAGLQNLKSQYFLLMFSGDLLHSQTLGRLSYVITHEKPVDYYSSYGMTCDEARWATAAADMPQNNLMVFNTNTAICNGSFQPSDEHTFDTIWKFTAKLSCIKIPEILYFRVASIYDNNALHQYKLFQEQL